MLGIYILIRSFFYGAQKKYLSIMSKFFFFFLFLLLYQFKSNYNKNKLKRSECDTRLMNFFMLIYFSLQKKIIHSIIHSYSSQYFYIYHRISHPKCKLPLIIYFFIVTLFLTYFFYKKIFF